MCVYAPVMGRGDRGGDIISLVLQKMLVEILHHTEQKGDRGIVNYKGGRFKVALFRKGRMHKGQVKQKVSLLRKYVQ